LIVILLIFSKFCS